MSGAASSMVVASRPVRVSRAAELLTGTKPGTPEFDEAVEEVATAAFKKCHPLDNVPGDAEYRREMVPVYVRRTLRAAVEDKGPVHHL